MEIWKDIQGYEGYYQVSNLGAIISLGRVIDYGHQKAFRDERIIKYASDKNGYLICCLNKNGKGKNFKVHRIVAESFIGNPLNYPQVNHKDGIKTNNVPENLEWCNNSQNVKHAYNTGLAKAASGYKHGGCKVTPEIIKAVREEYLLGNITQRELSEKYPIKTRTLVKILNNQIYV